MYGQDNMKVFEFFATSSSHRKFKTSPGNKFIFFKGAISIQREVHLYSTGSNRLSCTHLPQYLFDMTLQCDQQVISEREDPLEPLRSSVTFTVTILSIKSHKNHTLSIV